MATSATKTNSNLTTETPLDNNNNDHDNTNVKTSDDKSDEIMDWASESINDVVDLEVDGSIGSLSAEGENQLLGTNDPSSDENDEKESSVTENENLDLTLTPNNPDTDNSRNEATLSRNEATLNPPLIETNVRTLRTRKDKDYLSYHTGVKPTQKTAPP